ncbi:MAG: hypothetical protein K2Q18_10695 [Bdellovibrionales bacterium]|nr:hypothetical protein [Bdellovibrionales bacterium]
MKSLMTALLLASSFSAMASTVKIGDELLNYSCRDSSNQEYSVVISSKVNAKFDEQVEIPSILSVKRVYPLGIEVMSVPQNFLGKFVYEDVMNNFVSNDKKTAFRLYADELDQTSLTTIINGKKSILNLDCNPKE